MNQIKAIVHTVTGETLEIILPVDKTKEETPRLVQINSFMQSMSSKHFGGFLPDGGLVTLPIHAISYVLFPEYRIEDCDA